jgi:hypothetical protein
MSRKITSIKILSLSISCLLFSAFSLAAQDLPAAESASADVKSVFFEKDGWRQAYPFFQLNSSENIILHFDLLGGGNASLWYRIIHCDRDWNVSDLFTSDYIEGYEENQVNDFLPSFNTKASYTHYALKLPNEDIKFKVSGNYVITIWTADDPGRPVLTKRFFVYEGSSPASVTFRRPMKPGTTDTHQQLEISVPVGWLPVTDPYSQVTLTVMQNGRPDIAHYNFRPDFVGNNRLEFNTLSDNTLFPGGNEFRYFDAKTIRQTRMNVRAIEFVDGFYHVLLLPSEDREFKPYFYNEDLDGKYIVAVEEGNDPDTDADYVWVYFTLPAYSELKGGSLYVAGAFNGWAYNDDNRMTWNTGKGQYEASILLKQGWYNFEYEFVPKGSQVPEGFHFEGSHYETENDYFILTYFRDPTLRYDRLTGAVVVNTRNPVQ